MQRYFISKNQKYGDQVRITGEDVHHLQNVLRVSIGEQLICCDGTGIENLAEIEEVSSQEIRCRILETFSSKGEPKTQVTLAQSLPKRDKFEWVLQKGTEIGAVGFLPFISERTVVKIDKRKASQKMTRWRRIVKEAAEQSHRGVIPEVMNPVSWSELLQELRQWKTVFIAYEKGGQELAQVLKEVSSGEILIVIGPEGGFSEREIQQAEECGAVRISLGSRILRTETAPLVALSGIFFWEQMNQ